MQFQAKKWNRDIEQANQRCQRGRQTRQGSHALPPPDASTELTKGKSMRANLALLLNNARLAAQIAKALRASDRKRIA
jgi:pseudouridine-5'-phosphate glycosidase